MTRHAELHDMLTGIRRADGDTAPLDPHRPDDAARRAHDDLTPDGPMPRWAGLMWGAVFAVSFCAWAAVIAWLL